LAIDISSLLQKKRGEIEYNLILDDVEIIAQEERLDFINDIVFNFKMQLIDEIITINGIIEAKIMLQCSRCVEKFPYDIKIDVFEEFTMNPELKDEDIILIENKKIDISKIISDNVLINLPIAQVCMESCKGLCHECGVNLNKEKCNCYCDEIDDRLEVLQKYFKN